LPRRLQQFLLVCTADKRGRKGMQDDDYPQARYLNDLFHAALTPKAQTFVDQGLEGTDIGKALREARLRAISDATPRARSSHAPN
jgi:tRNA nucleotidyltransferase (CCA-adding enzyme)